MPADRNTRRCAYCGHPIRPASRNDLTTACTHHADLPKIEAAMMREPPLPAMREELRAAVKRP